MFIMCKNHIYTRRSINCIAKAVILKGTVACTVISLSILWYIICSAILQLLLVLFCLLFWSLCFNKYVFYGTQRNPTKCLMCLSGVAVGVKTKMLRYLVTDFCCLFCTVYLHIVFISKWCSFLLCFCP